MKTLLFALLALSLLVITDLFAKDEMMYYQYRKQNSFDVGSQPHYIFYDKSTKKANIFCLGKDLNSDGVKDYNDIEASWWIIEVDNSYKTYKAQEFGVGDFNAPNFQPAIDETLRTIFIPSGNKVFRFGLDDYKLQDSIIINNKIEGIAGNYSLMFLSVNPTVGESGKVLVYNNGSLMKEIAVGLKAQNIAVYSNQKATKAIAVINVGDFVTKSSVSFIEFGKNDKYTKIDVEVGMKANSIYYKSGYIYVVCFESNSTYKINADTYKIEKILHSGMKDNDRGPRQMAFNDEYGFISDYSGDVRMVDLNKGVKEIIKVGGEIEGVAILSPDTFIATTQNNKVILFNTGAYIFDEYHKNDYYYDFCETCEKPQVMVMESDYGMYVLCVGDSAKGILPSITSIKTAFPCTTPGNSEISYMGSQEIYKFNSYVFKKYPPVMTLSGGSLYVSTDEKLLKFNVSYKAAVIAEYDFPGAFFLQAGTKYDEDFVYGLNKEGSFTIWGDDIKFEKLDKPLVDGIITKDVKSGKYNAAFVYNVDNMMDLELIQDQEKVYFTGLGNNGRVFTDNSFHHIYYENFTENSSEILDFTIETRELQGSYHSGLISNKSGKGIFVTEENVLGELWNGSPGIVIPSELGDIRFIDSQGQLSRIIPMPSAPRGYLGNNQYFYTLLPDQNLVCMYGMIPGAVKDNNRFQDLGFKIYPNPANDFAKIELQQDFGKTKLEILNITGEVVFSTEFYGLATTLNLHQLNLPTGYYNVIITADDKKGLQPLIMIK